MTKAESVLAGHWQGWSVVHAFSPVRDRGAIPENTPESAMSRRFVPIVKLDWTA